MPLSHNSCRFPIVITLGQKSPHLSYSQMVQALVSDAEFYEDSESMSFVVTTKCPKNCSKWSKITKSCARLFYAETKLHGTDDTFNVSTCLSLNRVFFVCSSVPCSSVSAPKSLAQNFAQASHNVDRHVFTCCILFAIKYLNKFYS